jgi:tetratricopeptide (TPR) repeat protein
MPEGGREAEELPSTPAGCLGETQLALLVCRRADPRMTEAALEHLDGCPACRALAAELARASTMTLGGHEVGGDGHGPITEVEPGAAIGRYIVVQRLGAGGMGVVYAAYDPQLDRKVAVKLLRPRRRASAVAELEREARSLARVSHPNVVAVHDVGAYGDLVMLVMELVDGVTLRAWLSARRRTPREILQLLHAAGEGLHAAHRAGVVHRDVKPENVLVGKDGRARITDFGLAVLDEEASAPGAIAGTLPYMAPEQLRGDPADARTDQFAFAAMLYEALSGARPYGGDTPEERLAAFARGLAARPPTRGLPRSAWGAIRRALDPDPAKRYPAMKDLLAGLAVSGRTSTKRSAALAVAFAVVVAAAVYGVAHERRLERAAVCHGAEKQLAGVWDGARRSDVERAFRAHPEVPFAETSLASTEKALDAYAHGWAQARSDVCEATRVRGEQSEALMDQRMMCLDDRKRELSSLVDEMSHATPKTLELAVQASGALSTLESCTLASPTALQARPRDPEAAARFEALHATVADARARVDVGDVQPARQAIDAALPAVRELGDRRLVAEAELLLGETQSYGGELPQAEQAYLEAVWAAASGGHDDVVARAYLRLADVMGNQLADQAAGARYERFAEATIARLGGPRDLQAELFTTRAARLGRASDYEGAATLGRRALDLLEGLGLGDTRRAAGCWNVIAVARKRQGRIEEARAAIERAVDIRRRLLGVSHPETMRSLINRGTIELEDGRWDDALATFDGVLAGLVARTGDATSEGAMVHNNRGIALAKKGELTAARAEFERATQISAKVSGDHPATALAEMNVGDLDRMAGQPSQAVDDYREAQETLARSKSQDPHTAGRILAGMGQAELDLGHFDAAESTLGKALALLESGSFDPADLADAQFAMARTLEAERKDAPRSLQLARAALAAYESHPGAHRDELAAVRQWLASKGASASVASGP